MGKNEDRMFYVVAVVAAVFVLFAANSMGFINIGKTAAVGNTGGMSTATGQCPDSGKTDLSLMAKYQNFSGNSEVQVNTTYAIYLKDAYSATASGTTGTASAVTASGVVNCIAPANVFHVIYGDGTTYYYQDTTPATTTGAIMASPDGGMLLKKVGTVGVKGSNSTTLGNAAIQVWGMIAGVPDNTVVLQVKEGAVDSYFGNGAYIVEFVYPTSNLSAVLSDTGSVVACPSHVSVAAGYVARCYEINHALANGAYDNIGVTLQPQSGVTPANGTVIGVTIVDKGTVLKNGQVISAYENPDNLADVGATDVTYTITVRA